MKNITTFTQQLTRNHCEWYVVRLLLVLKLMISTSFSSNAQLFYSDNIQVTVDPAVQLTILGNAQFQFGSSVANSGVIALTGDWINSSGTGLFTLNAGAVNMNGFNQNITGSNATTFYNLNLFSGTKSLKVNATTGGNVISAAGSLNCNDAVFDLNSHTLIVNNSSPAAITRTTGYILSEDADNSSKIHWKLVTQGMHTIPFGNTAGEDVSFSVVPLAGGSGGPPAIFDLIVSTYPTFADNTPYPFTPELVTHVNGVSGLDNSMNTVDRFWNIQKSGNADYTFTWPASENAASGNINMRAQRWEPVSLGWEAPLPLQSTPTAQTLKVPNVATSGTWTIASQTNPLPVTLLYFDAKPIQQKVICRWVTAAEINNDFFEVLRSSNGIDFEPIGRTEGNGTTTQTTEYLFTDVSPLQGVSWYRLKQTDFDGTSVFSAIKEVRFDSGQMSINAGPNPCSGNLVITTSDAHDTPLRILMYDAYGRLVKSEPIVNSHFTLSIAELAAGCYNIEIWGTEKYYQNKILKVDR